MTLLAALVQEQGTMIEGMIRAEAPLDTSNMDGEEGVEAVDIKGDQTPYIHGLKLILIAPEPIAQVQNMPNMLIKALNTTFMIQ